MNISKSVLKVAAALKLEGIGRAWVANNIRAYSTNEDIVHLVKKTLARKEEIARKRHFDFNARVAAAALTQNGLAEIAADIAQAKVVGTGRVWVENNITEDLRDEEIINLAREEMERKEKQAREKFLAFKGDDFARLQDETQAELDALKGDIDGAIAFCDDGFPRYAGKINDGDKPVLLTYKGDLELLTNPNLLRIAVIGFLNPCEKIQKLEEKILEPMLAKNTVIVSGLACGVDQKAHEYALQKKGATIAFLPDALCNIVPAANAALAQNIVKNGGLLVCEYLASIQKPKEIVSRYLDRNRLQALFCDAVCLIASPKEVEKAETEPEENEELKPVEEKKVLNARYALEQAQKWGKVCLSPKIYKGNALFDERFDLNREILQNGAVEITSQNIDAVLAWIAQSKNAGRF